MLISQTSIKFAPFYHTEIRKCSCIERLCMKKLYRMFRMETTLIDLSQKGLNFHILTGRPIASILGCTAQLTDRCQ